MKSLSKSSDFDVSGLSLKLIIYSFLMDNFQENKESQDYKRLLFVY